MLVKGIVIMVMVVVMNMTLLWCVMILTIPMVMLVV